jgi:hypothetical protein
MRLSLANFLGATSEIRIIDFLAENMDMAYNQTEIGKCLGMSRRIINQKIPILIYNNIIEEKERKGNTVKYGLKRNDLVSDLISAIYDHSFMMAESEEEEEKALTRISRKYQTFSNEEIECYCAESPYKGFYVTQIPKTEHKNMETKWEREIAQPEAASASA